jgi:hypothetical protein
LGRSHPTACLVWADTWQGKHWIKVGCRVPVPCKPWRVLQASLWLAHSLQGVLARHQHVTLCFGLRRLCNVPRRFASITGCRSTDMLPTGLRAWLGIGLDCTNTCTSGLVPLRWSGLLPQIQLKQVAKLGFHSRLACHIAHGHRPGERTMSSEVKGMIGLRQRPCLAICCFGQSTAYLLQLPMVPMPAGQQLVRSSEVEGRSGLSTGPPQPSIAVCSSHPAHLQLPRLSCLQHGELVTFAKAKGMSAFSSRSA